LLEKALRSSGRPANWLCFFKLRSVQCRYFGFRAWCFGFPTKGRFWFCFFKLATKVRTHEFVLRHSIFLVGYWIFQYLLPPFLMDCW
jgi:hypothetical protein